MPSIRPAQSAFVVLSMLLIASIICLKAVTPAAAQPEIPNISVAMASDAYKDYLLMDLDSNTKQLTQQNIITGRNNWHNNDFTISKSINMQNFGVTFLNDSTLLAKNTTINTSTDMSNSEGKDYPIDTIISMRNRYDLSEQDSNLYIKFISVNGQIHFPIQGKHTTKLGCKTTNRATYCKSLISWTPNAPAFSLTINGENMPAYQPKQALSGQPENWTNAWEQWGNGFIEIPVTLPNDGGYTFTMMAYVKPGGNLGAQSEVRIDQSPIPVGNTYSQIITALRPTQYTWTSYATAGAHKIQLSLMNHQNTVGIGNLMIQSLTITNNATPVGQLPPNPPGSRDPTLQPYSSYSIWNTSIGSGAQWSNANSADTIDLRHPGGYINASQWSLPYYIGQSNQPSATFTVNDSTYPIDDVTLHIPANAAPALPVKGGDHHMIVTDANNQTIYHFFGCSPSATGFNCQQSEKDNICGEALGGYGWGSGVIRQWEIQAGAIKHMLRASLPITHTKAGNTWISGLAWPAMRSDYNGPNGEYTGHVLYGSTFGIPASVDITKLGLTPSGLVLARALQDYGAMQRDTGGNNGINFFAEPTAEGMPQLTDMRNDVDKIIPYLAIMRNQAPTTINGGGERRQPLVEGLNPAICPN